MIELWLTVGEVGSLLLSSRDRCAAKSEGVTGLSPAACRVYRKAVTDLPAFATRKRCGRDSGQEPVGFYREAVRGLSPGWRLWDEQRIEARSADKIIAQGGGLAEPWVRGNKKRVALKERKKKDPGTVSSSSNSTAFYCSALDRFLRSFRAARFTADTQGSAKPPPWEPVGFEAGVER